MAGSGCWEEHYAEVRAQLSCWASRGRSPLSPIYHNCVFLGLNERAVAELNAGTTDFYANPSEVREAIFAEFLLDELLAERKKSRAARMGRVPVSRAIAKARHRFRLKTSARRSLQETFAVSLRSAGSSPGEGIC